MKIHRIIEVTAHPDYFIQIRFDDGKSKLVDVKPFIGEGISKDLKDFDYFKSVQVIDGYISWKNGFDFCPNFLYEYSAN